MIAANPDILDYVRIDEIAGEQRLSGHIRTAAGIVAAAAETKFRIIGAAAEHGFLQVGRDVCPDAAAELTAVRERNRVPGQSRCDFGVLAASSI